MQKEYNPNIVRLSELFTKTLREDPASADTVGHKLLLRAGYIRQIGFGIYTWLPLGLKLRRKIEKIVREEMDKIGGQEVLLPALLPAEYFKKSGRWNEFGNTMFKLQDRRKNDYLLGPTHEELFTQLGNGSFTSYKDLPAIIYQIQTKYRDELRARGGLLRTREFVMKDSYSFDIDKAGLEKSYQAHRDAYQRIFKRLGIDVDIVSALAGPMGGSMSEEFLAASEVGEDFWASNDNGFAANVENIKIAQPEKIEITDDMPKPKTIHTPNASSIGDVVDAINNSPEYDGEPIKPENVLKIVLITIREDIPVNPAKKVIAVGIPGDREIDAKRLATVTGDLIPSMTTSDEISDNLDIVPGFIGPNVLGINSQSESANIKIYVDPRVVAGSKWVVGGNKKDYHTVNMVAGRDFKVDGIFDVAQIHNGDPAPDGSGALRLQKGIELGHIFALGQKYSKALGLKVLDQNGKQQYLEMGSYGIGISRVVATLAEMNNDDKGLSFKGEVLPADVHIISLAKSEEDKKTADEIINKLAKKYEVILDDRAKVGVGAKFKDAELMGVPYILVLGSKLKDGLCEFNVRGTDEKFELPIDEAGMKEIEKILDKHGL